MSFALIEYLENINKLGTFKFNYNLNLIEQEGGFLKFVQEIHNKSLYKDKIKYSLDLMPFRVDFDNFEINIKSLIKDKSYDFIILSFVFNENKPTKKKSNAIFSFLSKILKENGIILFFEAPSDYLIKYMEIDFRKYDLFRVAPCLNGNKKYGREKNKFYPFVNPCGDLCKFQIKNFLNPYKKRFQITGKNSFSYLVYGKL